MGRVIDLRGNTGVRESYSLVTYGSAGLYASAPACGGGVSGRPGIAAGVLRGSRIVYRITLDASTPPGGLLSVSTCYRTMGEDTVIAVGKGCPTSAAAFNCVAANDDGGAGTQLCPDNAKASYVTLPAVAPFVY